MPDSTGRLSVASEGPQFWESAPLFDKKRIYFTAETGGRVIGGASAKGAMLSREQAISLAAWLLRVADAETTLDQRAEAAYLAGASEILNAVPWSDLAAWQREAWRCEVDSDRDPAGITRAKEAENG